jgi:hypothetical protein
VRGGGCRATYFNHQQFIGGKAVDTKSGGQFMPGDTILAVEVDQERFLRDLLKVGDLAAKRLFETGGEVEADRHSVFPVIYV